MTIATPVTKPQAARPRLMPDMSRAPRRNSGWRHSADKSLMAGLSYERRSAARAGGEARRAAQESWGLASLGLPAAALDARFSSADGAGSESNLGAGMLGESCAATASILFSRM